MSEPSFEPARSPRSQSAGFADLKPRLVAGIVLGALTLALTYAGPRPFAIVILAAALVMSWEWGRVVRGEDWGLSFLVHAVAAAMATVLATVGHPALGLVALVVGAIVLLVMPSGTKRMISAIGVAYVGVPAIAMVWLRSDEPLGFLAILFVFLVVWGSDIAAFAAGRTLGGPKLWPRVSPNKTWSGFLGALLAGLVGGAVFAWFVPGASSFGLALTGLALAIVAQLGDLAESALKRWFGVKDASALIPGHGGVMDRADSTVAVSTVIALIALAVDASAPARVILLGG